MEKEETVYINDVQAAKIMGLSKQSLRNWRHLNRGLPYYKIGRSVRYALADVIEFMESRKINTEGN
jgi:excisionase family DNA binding protein